MKKNDCNIVRDLMPLVLDRVASDESREIVENHIASCEACGRQYEAMKTELPEGTRAAYEEEQRKFAEALRTVKKKRLKRRITAIALAFVLCMAAAFGGLYAYDRLYNRYSVAVDNQLYALSCVQLRDGRIVVSIDDAGIHFDFLTNMDEHRENGEQILYIYAAAAPIHPERDDRREESKWCMAILAPGEENRIGEIRQGKPNSYVTLWSKGEAIPAASEEMEAYFAVADQLDAWFSNAPASADGKVRLDHEYFLWQDKMEEARRAVPEWQ